MFKLIVFDWDGTLADSVDGIVRCKQDTARYFNVSAPTRQTIKQALGMGFELAMSHCFPSLESQHLNQLAKKFRELMLLPEYSAKLFPGAYELLDLLRKKGIKLGLATSKSRSELNNALHLHGLIGYFDIVCCGECYIDKPDPLMLHHMMRLFDFSPSQVLMIGDTVTDIQFARNAQVCAFAVTYGAHSQLQLQAAKPSAIFADIHSIAQELNDISC